MVTYNESGVELIQARGTEGRFQYRGRTVRLGVFNEDNVWYIGVGLAVKAAGAIHTDFEKKFIRAETINWERLIELGGYSGAKGTGELRLEGKTYIVQDGDVLVIRHS